ncbi:hypothetical protein U1Q18_022052 [Sarracenia purpurea var. burkii]
MWRHRSIDGHMKTILLLPSLSPYLSPSTTTTKSFRTVFAISNPIVSTLLPILPLPQLRYSSSPCPRQTLLLHRISHSSKSSPPRTNRSFRSETCFAAVAAKCISSISSANTLEWNEPVPCSEVGGGSTGSDGEENEKAFISVRAYFFSTRFVLAVKA